MFVLEPFAIPFIYLFKWLAAAFLWLSNACYFLYSTLLGWSIKLNDLVESNIWSRD